MLGHLRIRKFYWASFLILTFFAINVMGCAPAGLGPSQQYSGKREDVFRFLIVNEDESRKGIEKAREFARVVTDQSLINKRKRNDVKVKITDRIPRRISRGRGYDVVFLIRPELVSERKILAFTSDPVEECRPFLRKLLTRRLSSTRIKRVYRRVRLVTKPRGSEARSIRRKLKTRGWLNDC